MRNIVVSPNAERQITEAHDWLSTQAGLGDELIAVLDALFRRLQQFPYAHPRVHRNVRRALLQRFPYAVFYLVEDTRIVILAVLHQASDPMRWPS